MLDNLITGDEKWVFYINPIRKIQWLPRDQAATPTPKLDLHPKKRMISVWWGIRGVVYWELLPEKITINGMSYSAQLTKLEVAVQTYGLQGSQVYFQHDNARPHIAKCVKDKLERLSWNLLPHPPYSPDLAPSDNKLFRTKVWKRSPAKTLSSGVFRGQQGSIVTASMTYLDVGKRS